MGFKYKYCLLMSLIGILPELIKGLDINEGETLTLTCPRPSQTLPVVWLGPPNFSRYSRGLQIDIDLPAELRDRLLVTGDHGNGYYNLQVGNIRKADSGDYMCKIGSREIRSVNVQVKTQAEQNQGLFPYILNLATRATIEANATCGLARAEYFCKLVEHVDLMPRISHCDYCNAREISQAHPITNAIDGSNLWWQSPSISNGWEYNYVTITMDLGLIYQVAYVVVKAANAPRPGNWILEKSVDGITFKPWHYFAITDDDCANIYKVPAVEGKPSYDYLADDEVRCTSYFSKLSPFENGEIFISLTNGRPGILKPSKILLDFTSARYVRLRFQKIRTLNADLMSLKARDPRNLDPSVTRRYFYSIKDISVGGQCICYGHATECQRRGNTDNLACVCQHNTCGTNCEICCPLYNNKPWVRGGSNGNNTDVNCEACNCHGHTSSCVYNATVDNLGLSLNMAGELKGGGVCINCTDFTTGINCERCLPGYFRPWGVPHNSPRPCRPCSCRASIGSTGICVEDDSRMDKGLMPGSCICKTGFSGQNCDQCAVGYHSYPRCEPCSCSTAGTVDPKMCEGRCVCKQNVEGANCDRCKPGFYDLRADNAQGCRQCFCFGISSTCQSAGLGLVQITDMSSNMDGWTIITLNDDWFSYFPTLVDGWLEYRTFPARDQNMLDPGDGSRQEDVIYYWQAPHKYYGNRLASYGGSLNYNIKFTLDTSAPVQTHLAEANVILQGANLTITNGRSYIREDQDNKRSVVLDETNWFELDTTNGRYIGSQHVSRKDFMLLLFDLRRILIRATHHTAQDNVMLKNVLLDTSNAGSTNTATISGVEKCTCPRGYTGLSCESCDIGWRRLNNILYGGQCIPCNCYGHSKTCDPYTGRCLMCTDNTEGNNCEVCRAGFYGDPTRGTPDDCKPCGCPLTEPSNNFASTCALSPKFDNPDAFVCLDCAVGYTGERCERCDHGYYGFPGVLGDRCQPCKCNGNINPNMVGSCDQLTGDCRLCLHNTEGPNCGRCRTGYFGTARNGDCKLCSCDPFGSVNMTCNRDTGFCTCKPHYTGRQCDRCEAGYGDIQSGCKECNCSRVGSIDYRCHPVTGQCVCRPGVTGLTCDRCQTGFYRYSTGGCTDCRCYRLGSNSTEICDLRSGECNCLPFVKGEFCNSCEENYWGLESGKGCSPCNCDPIGSYFAQCESLTGQCRCKQGVTGQQCDTCVEGYYGLVSKGECLECKPCEKPGHICHMETGECVCPPNTEGERCERCVDTYWGYHPRLGCKACNCDVNGSVDQDCDPLNGQCLCRADYAGVRCNSCLFGFYNFPDCTLCLCSVEGTEPSSCSPSGACSCQERDGQCTCKSNTGGRTCQQCVNSSFSLDLHNPNGCTDCFCFGRADTCRQAQYVWIKKELPDQAVTFSNKANTRALPQQHGFYVIPSGQSSTAVVGTQGEPVYWRVPGIKGDMTLSYNGELSFTLEQVNHKAPLSDLEGLVDKPLVIVLGYGIPVVYRSDVRWSADRGLQFRVRLHEHYWRSMQNGLVSRQMMMVILQNVTDVLIRATWDNSAFGAKLTGMSIDHAVDNAALLGQPALGIEECKCRPEYIGLSCQNPADGYYRVPNVGPVDFTDLIDIVGRVEPCACNGHSDKCDPETGICINCTEHTMGKHCELCATGYYGDPSSGGACQRCACPLEVDSNNFSPTCVRVADDLVCTACREGYDGARCQYCAEGYYGDPSTLGETCRRCGCNPEGSVTQQCDYNGVCTCLPGITGLKCDQCQPMHAVVQGQCVSCYEGCTRELMLDMDDLEAELRKLKFNTSNVNVSAPYRRLQDIRNETRVLSDRLQDLKYAEIMNITKQLEDLEKQVSNTDTESETSLAMANQNKQDGEKLLRDGRQIEDTIALLQMEVKDLIDDLEQTVASTFHNRSGVNVTAALTRARRILREIKARNFTDMAIKARKEHDEAELLSQRIHGNLMRVTNTSDMDAKVKAFEDAVGDLLNHVESSIKNSEDVGKKADDLRAAIARIKQYLDDTEALRSTLENGTAEASKLLEDAKSDLNMTEENIRNLEERLSTLDDAERILREKEEGLKAGLPGAAVLVDKARSHADNLTRTAENLQKLFENIRLAAADPMRAARVYDDIVKAIAEAEVAAKKAMDDAQNATGMLDFDVIKSQVANSLALSKKLRERADNITKNGIAGLDEDLLRVKDNLQGINDTQKDIKERHDVIVGEIDDLDTNIVDRLSDIQSSLAGTERASKQVKDNTDKIVDKVNNDMMPKIRELEGIVGGNFNDIYNTMANVKSNISTIQSISEGLDRRISQSQRLRSDLHEKLSKLKQSIQEAREEANKVKTSLSADGKCVKKFRPMTQPGTINSIRFAFKTSRPGQDMMMVLLQNQGISNGDTEKEFLAVELRDGRVRFTWNVGGGIGVVTDNKKVVSEVSTIKESEKWYRVKAERIGGLGRLTVHRLSDTAGAPITNTSTVGFSLMGLDDTTDIFVSGVPQGVIVYPSLTSRNFSGCMGDMHIDETLVGLFNFERNTMDSCSACLEVPSQPPAANVYSFDGTGYAVTDKNRFLSPLIANIILDFKTYWDNASLFFVGNPQTSEFMAIELENGFVVFKYYLGQGSYGRIQSEMKYNRNQWVSVAAARSGLLAVLEVSKVESLITQGNPGDHLLNVSMNDLFFGGIPPSVNLDIYRKGSGHHVSGDSFLGCMRSLQLSSNAVNLWDGKSTIGVLEGCKESGLRSIGFYGSGFAEYQGVSMISSESDLSISFSTTEPDGLLLLAKNVNGDSYYSLALKDGLVYGKFSGGRNPISINSKERYNDGKVHNVAVRKLDRKIEIYVDDKVVATGNLDRQFRDIAVREDGGLYLGGVPEGLNLDDQAETSKSLDGCLSDVVINRGILNINQPKQYDRADIGRCKLMEMQNDRMLVDPEPPLASDAPSNIRMLEVEPMSRKVKPTKNSLQDKMGTPTSGPTPCATVARSVDFQVDALTFGEADMSFHQINTSKKEILRKFEISLDFRTFYQNGLLIYLSNLDHTEFVAAQIKDHVLVLVLTRNDDIKVVTVNTSTSLADGQWHNVKVDKNLQRISVVVDGNEENMGSRKIAKVLKVEPPLFIGGVPSSFKPLLNENVVAHSVRGCIRGLKIDGDSRPFSEATLASGVEKCYAKVEKGAYFNGEAWGLYDDKFSVGQKFKMELDFRTNKADGILVNITSQNLKNSIGLEISKGKVIFTAVIAGQQFSLKSQNGFCDNVWHKVKVGMEKRTIAMQLDDGEIYQDTLAGDITLSNLRAPLYLGATPDVFAKVASSRHRGYQGCMRDVIINNKQVNWFDLQRSFSLQKTACPVA